MTDPPISAIGAFTEARSGLLPMVEQRLRVPGRASRARERGGHHVARHVEDLLDDGDGGDRPEAARPRVARIEPVVETAPAAVRRLLPADDELAPRLRDVHVRDRSARRDRDLPARPAARKREHRGEEDERGPDDAAAAEAVRRSPIGLPSHGSRTIRRSREPLAVAADRPVAGGSGAGREQPAGPVDALQRVLAAVDELEPRAGDEVAGRRAAEHLARRRRAGLLATSGLSLAAFLVAAVALASPLLSLPVRGAGRPIRRRRRRTVDEAADGGIRPVPGLPAPGPVCAGTQSA